MNKLQTTLDEAIKALAIDSRFPLPQRLEMIGAVSAMQDGFKESLALPDGDPGKLTPAELDLMAEDYEAIKAIMQKRSPQVSIGTLALCMTLYGLELAYAGLTAEEGGNLLDRVLPEDPSKADSGEQVLVATVPWLAHVFGGATLPQGFTSGTEGTLQAVLEESHFQPRAKMEQDTFYKQLIPYCIVIDRATNKILTYTRGKAGTEERLHDKLSMGFGGHVNPVDSLATLEQRDPLASVQSCVAREMFEEIGLYFGPGEIQPRFVGFVNNDADAVGAVHLGLVYLIEVEPRWVDFEKAEHAVVNPRWRDVNGLLSYGINHTRLEEWSKMLAEPLFGTRSRAADDGAFPRD